MPLPVPTSSARATGRRTVRCASVVDGRWMPATWSARSPPPRSDAISELVERDELHERRRDHARPRRARLHERVETERREVALGDVHVDRHAEQEEADERRERARLGVEPAQVDGQLGRPPTDARRRVQEAGGRHRR